MDIILIPIGYLAYEFVLSQKRRCDKLKEELKTRGLSKEERKDLNEPLQYHSKLSEDVRSQGDIPDPVLDYLDGRREKEPTPHEVQQWYLAQNVRRRQDLATAIQQMSGKSSIECIAEASIEKIRRILKKDTQDVDIKLKKEAEAFAVVVIEKSVTSVDIFLLKLEDIRIDVLKEDERTMLISELIFWILCGTDMIAKSILQDERSVNIFIGGLLRSLSEGLSIYCPSGDAETLSVLRDKLANNFKRDRDRIRAISDGPSFVPGIIIKLELLISSFGEIDTEAQVKQMTQDMEVIADTILELFEDSAARLKKLGLKELANEFRF